MSVMDFVKSKLAGQPAYQPSDIVDEQKRVSKARRLYDYYEFDRQRILEYVQVAMLATFKPETIKEMQFPLINIVRKIINQLAVAYIEPAQRYVVVPKATKVEGTEKIQIADKRAERDQAIYQDVLATSNINAAAKEWNRMAKLLDTVHVGVMYRDGRIEYDVFAPHDLEVRVSRENYLEPDLVQYDRAFGEDTYTVIWTADQHRIVDKDNRMVEGLNPWNGENKYGLIPIIPCRLKTPDSYWGEGDEELVNINEKINILIASMTYNAIMQSHSQAFGINLRAGESDDKLKTGPGWIIEANNVQSSDVLPDFRFVSPSPAIDSNVALINWLIKQAAVMKGLSSASVSSDVSDASGVSKMVDLAEMRERRQDDIESLRPFEKRLFDVTRKVWNTNEDEQIGEEAIFGVDFTEPELPMTAKEEWEIKMLKMPLGLYSPIDDMIDEDEGIDAEQALDYIKRNQEWNRQIRAAGGTKP